MMSNRSGLSASRAAPDVDDHVVALDVRVVRGGLVADLVEQPVGELHDVVFGEARHFLTTVASRVLEGEPGDPLAAGPGDELERLHHFVGVPVLDPTVEIFFVLPHDHDVHLRVERVDERRVRDAWPDVGEKPEAGSNRDVEALVAAPLRRRDRAFEEHLGAADRLPGVRRDPRRVTALVDGLPDGDTLDLEARAGGF